MKLRLAVYPCDAIVCFYMSICIAGWILWWMIAFLREDEEDGRWHRYNRTHSYAGRAAHSSCNTREVA